MSETKYKSVTIPVEVYEQAEELRDRLVKGFQDKGATRKVRLGLGEAIGIALKSYLDHKRSPRPEEVELGDDD